MSARPRAHLSPKTRAKWHAVERDGTTLAEHELLRALGRHHMRVIRKRLGNTFGIGSGDLGHRFSPVELQSHECALAMQARSDSLGRPRGSLHVQGARLAGPPACFPLCSCVVPPWPTMFRATS